MKENGKFENFEKMRDTRKKRQRQTTQTGANDKMIFEPGSAFMIRMHQ